MRGKPAKPNTAAGPLAALPSRSSHDLAGAPSHTVSRSDSAAGALAAARAS